MTDVPPQRLEDFLPWFRTKSEIYWETCRMPSLQEQSQTGVSATHWRTGTKWKKGLSLAEIKAVEARFNVTFPSDYKLFLKILNTPSKGMVSYNFKKYGNCLAAGQDAFLFPDWIENQTSAQSQLAWPIDGWVLDIERDQGWFDFMGPKPATLKEQIDVVRDLVENAPPLIPVFGHRYISNSGIVLSVYQTDVIVYAPSLRDYLLREFSALIGEYPIQRMASATVDRAKSIPVWGMLL